MRILTISALAIGLLASAPALGACRVAPVTLTDHARSSALPYASPADRGAGPYRVRGLAWGPANGDAGDPVSGRELLGDALTVDAAVNSVSAALLFYGVRPTRDAIAAAIEARSGCGASNRISPAPEGGVIIVGALPPLFYAGLAEKLADAGIATVAITGGEGDLRFVLNALIAEHGWPTDRIALVGHGQGGSAAALVAMTRGVRALVSLDGFEALDPVRHPGLSASPFWRPGHLRAPVLHWQTAARPHADGGFYDRALRSEYAKIEVGGVEASEWATVAQLAPAPPALAGLLDAPLAGDVAAVTARYLTAKLTGALEPASVAGRSRLSLATRAALPDPAIRADGLLDEPVWAAAGGDPALRFAEDCDYLYLALVSGDPTPFSSALFIDADRSGGAAWTLTDLLLHSSNSLCTVAGTATLERRHCGATDAWWGGSRTVRAGDPSIAEYYVAKSKLGLARCTSARGIAAAGSISLPDGERKVPAASDRARPDSWIPLG